MSDEMHDDEMADDNFPDDDDEDGGGGDEGGDEPGDDEGGDDEGGDDEGGDDEPGDDEESDDEESDDEESDDEESDDEESDDEESDEDEDEESDDEESDEDEDEESDDEDEDDEDEDEESDDEDEDDEDSDDEDEESDDDEDEEEADSDDEDVEYQVLADDDVFESADDYPNADESDFEDDKGDWTDDDYEEAAEHLFGESEFFGEEPEQRFLDMGWEQVDESTWQDFSSSIDSEFPGLSEIVQLYAVDGVTKVIGFMTHEELMRLIALYPDLDTSEVKLTIKEGGPKYKPKPLPKQISKVKTKDGVDLRKYCTDIGDQGQTSRCSAFAWTHAVEMVSRIQKKDYPRLSCSFTMLQFQKMQGDYKDFQWAFEGGEGTVGGTKPGEVVIKSGTCRHDLWPNDEPAPKASEADMAKDAKKYKLDANLQAIKATDLKKVLSAGYPVHVGMNTGKAFSKVGRDGIFETNEGPEGRHGRHAMLIVGYVGNYYILKNSWGTNWGDKGYAYVAKKVLENAEPNLVAILPTKGK